MKRRGASPCLRAGRQGLLKKGGLSQFEGDEALMKNYLENERPIIFRRGAPPWAPGEGGHGGLPYRSLRTIFIVRGRPTGHDQLPGGISEKRNLR